MAWASRGSGARGGTIPPSGERAAARRAAWQGGTAKSFEELEEKGLEFWQDAPPSARLEAMWQLIVDAWIIEGGEGQRPGVDVSVVGVGRYEG